MSQIDLSEFTSEREDLLRDYRDKWKSIVLSKTVDRQKAEEAIKDAYEYIFDILLGVNARGF